MGERASTKGPWSVKHTDTTYYVESADGIRIVSTSWHDRLRKPYPLKAEAFANASMAAAAPDMFEALLTALPYIECAEEDDAYKPGVVAKVTAQIRAALAKAGLTNLADATPKNPLPGEIAP